MGGQEAEARERMKPQGLLMIEGKREGRVHVGLVHAPRKMPIRWMQFVLFCFFNVVYFCYLCVHAHVISHMLTSGGSPPLSLLALGIELRLALQAGR